MTEPDPNDLADLAAAMPDLSDVIAIGEQASAGLAEIVADTDADAVLKAALLRLAHDHPVYVLPPGRRSPADPADRSGPVDSLAAAADVLRAYLDDADPDVTIDRAREALALVEQVAAAGDNLLPPSAVAARLGVSVDTVRRLISEGELPAMRLGYRTMRVPVEGLAAYRARLDGRRAERPSRPETAR